MKKSLYFFATLVLFLLPKTYSQEIYVDSQNGNDTYVGDLEAPFKSLSNAIAYVNSLTGKGTITIKLFPGLYVLNKRLDINPVRMMTDSTRFVIEAVHMPDDADWSQEKMPKIQSVSSNNSETQFPHATGFLVSSAYVTIRGLKFLGNANPAVNYYYPISKENQELADLEVSQCYFIGNKETAPIQGGVWAHGQNNSVANCVFYECRNAVLFFNNVDGFNISNSIVYGAYESAFWFGPKDYEFSFNNNVIVNNNNFLVGPKNLKYSSVFSNSIIANNKGYVGYWSRDEQRVLELKNPDIKENGLLKSGEFNLKLNDAIKLDKDHLHLTGDTKKKKIKAGIFKDGFK
ncbi:hypothetical protein MTsPCn5_15150 [Croceitalea sp. MTPC5]|uniref:right-handed parallel beta-helix repeat-containing protein n=1 Tax=Croceitalea sp. MTPC5 TaxID=3056565 RepID=UPI002B3E7F6C|nr:hypothetical protein MTsPCn5_15150 [Croceitalea sp. MTPC5]